MLNGFKIELAQLNEAELNLNFAFIHVYGEQNLEYLIWFLPKNKY